MTKIEPIASQDDKSGGQMSKRDSKKLHKEE